MKKLLILVFGMLLFFGGCEDKHDSVENKSEKNLITIGAILPLTGSASVWGINSKNGMELAKKHFDIEQKIKIVYFDSKSDSKEAVNSLKNIISNHKNIQIIVGDIASSSVLAMSPIAEKNKIILLSPGASNPKISNSGDYIFRNFQSDALEAVKDFEYVINKLKWKKIVTLYINNAYGKGLEGVFIQELKQNNMEPIARLSFSQDQKDFHSLISRLKKMDIDGIYMAGYPVEMGLILKQMSEIGYKPSILATQSFDDPQIKKIAGDISNVIYSTPKPPNQKEEIVKRFQKEYFDIYNTKAGVTSDSGYDAFMIIYNIYKKYAFSNISSDIIKKELYHLKINGASGKYVFDKNGDVIKDFIFTKGG